jgi:N6-L-threonylcarbamoyladenine synthase
MLVLGIESSCDDLSMALIEGNRLFGNLTASQTRDHAPFGGVVPEIASRRHLDHLDATLEGLLKQAQVGLQDLEGIAATFAPGLVGSLLVGLNYAKGLAFARSLPFRGVHHIEAHLLSPFLEHQPEFPLLSLVVSGGHSHLFWVREVGDYRLLGHTVDDAAGEAFDKVAKRMGLPFPGGPVIERLAERGDPHAFKFALPAVKGKPLHTSFSGMKTAAAEYLKALEREFGADLPENKRADLAASFQRAVVQALTTMVERALELHPVRQIAVAGGVACNGPLRSSLAALAEKRGLSLACPSPKFCTDNGAMVAFAGKHYLERGQVSPLSLNAQARLSLGA